MIRLLTIASFFVASIRLINSNESNASLTLTQSSDANIDSLSADAQSITQLSIYVTETVKTKKSNDLNNYVTTVIPKNTKLNALKVITKCDQKRTLKNCAEEAVKKSVGEHQTKKEETGALGIESGNKLVESPVELRKLKTTNNTVMDLKSNVYKREPTQPTYLTSSIPLSYYKVSTTDKKNDTKAPKSPQAKRTELIHEAPLALDNLYAEVSTSYSVDNSKRSDTPTQIDQPTFSTSKTFNKFNSQVAKVEKVLHTTSLEQPRETPSMTPMGPEYIVKIKNHTDDQSVTKRPRLQDILKLANNSLLNLSRQIPSKQTTFGKVRYSKTLEVSSNSTYLPLNNSGQITSPLPSSFLHTTEFEVTFSTVDAETTQATTAARQIFHGNKSIEKIIQEMPWPVKKEAIVEGDIILGGLMMVHEREDSITCGPVMPQGGIQALEAMLFTLDRLNSSPEPLLPNITLGAHILDDCDKDTYGLEMAVDFIKGHGKPNGDPPPVTDRIGKVLRRHDIGTIFRSTMKFQTIRSARTRGTHLQLQESTAYPVPAERYTLEPLKDQWEQDSRNIKQAAD